MLEGEAVADRGAIIHDIHGVALGADLAHQRIDHVGIMGEAVGELAMVGCVALAKARIVRRDHMIAIGQQRDQVAEHVRRRREAVEQQHHRAVGGAGFAIEHLDAIDRGAAIMDRGGRGLRGDGARGRGDRVGRGSDAGGRQQHRNDQFLHHVLHPVGVAEQGLQLLETEIILVFIPDNSGKLKVIIPCYGIMVMSAGTEDWPAADRPPDRRSCAPWPPPAALRRG